MGININELDDVDVSTSTGASYEAPDDGDYNLVFTEMEYGNTSNNKGTGFKVKLTILDGDYAGQDVYTYYNVTNQNETAQRIGREQLKTVMTLTNVSNTDDIVGKSIRARLVGELNNYTDKNGVKRDVVRVSPILYMSLDGKNAKGEPVAEFVKKSVTAKDELAKLKAVIGQSGTTVPQVSTVQSNTQPDTSSQLDDDIPF